MYELINAFRIKKIWWLLPLISESFVAITLILYLLRRNVDEVRMDETKLELNYLDIDKMCRLCLSTSAETISIFNHQVIENEMTLKDQIKECSTVEIAEDDGLPQNICGTCYNKVNDWYYFKNCCKQTEITLRHYFSVKVLKPVQSSLDNKDGLSKVNQQNEVSKVHEEKIEEEVGVDSFSDYDDKPLTEVKMLVEMKKQLKKNSKLKSKESANENASKSEAKGRSPKAKPICIICKAKFNRFKELIEHQSKIHNLENMSYGSEHAYEFLGFSKDAFAVYKCHICKDGKEFSGRKELRNHCKSVHNTKIIQPYPCGHCDRQFPAWGLLVIHERKHTGEKPYSCDLCGKKNFISQSSLRRHKLMHLKVYNCQECNRDFNCDSALKAHIRCKHTKEKPFLCNVCGRSFSLSAILVTHMASHSSERKYVCDICGFASKTSGNHHRHKNTHKTGEAKFHCETCGKSFDSKLKLSSHQVIHRPVRPHVCKVCGKGFLYNNKLKRHALLVHEKERPFPCTLCGKQLASKFGLGIHLKTHNHNLQPKEEPTQTISIAPS